jgi:ubiquinone/menaquinone biosynthesis C-methylase UbiE
VLKDRDSGITYCQEVLYIHVYSSAYVNMSSYANYSAYSKTYDGMRSPLGIELYFGALVCKLGKPPSELHMLDAGCGTGNYSHALLQLGVGKATMLDANKGMLEKAREKLSAAEEFKGRYEILQHQLPDIPFSDATFDCVMLNNVLHHLATVNGDGVTADKTKCDAVIRAICRVLKPGGLFFLIDTLDHQIEKGVWYYPLNERVGKLMKARAPMYDEMCKTLASSGFNMGTLQTFVRLEGYPSIMNFEGTFLKETRDAVSWFADFTEEETKAMLAELTRMKEEGTLVDYFNKCDAGRKEVGQMTFLVVAKY